MDHHAETNIQQVYVYQSFWRAYWWNLARLIIFISKKTITLKHMHFQQSVSIYVCFKALISQITFTLHNILQLYTIIPRMCLDLSKHGSNGKSFSFKN